jgi:general secretion pathway protein L
MAESVNRPTVQQSAGHFLSWWRQQLWECVPEKLRLRWVQSRRPAMLSLAEDRFWLAGASLDQYKPFAHSAMAQNGGQVALVVGESNGFRRDIELPLAVENKLSQVLSYELDRLTPLRASDLYYGFCVKHRDTTAGTCRVELTAAPRARVTPMLETAKQKNLVVSRLLLAPQDVDTGMDMLANTSDRVEQAANGSSWINPALFGLCLVLIAALIAVPLWQKRQYVIELQPIETSAKSDAEAASVLQRQLEKQVNDYNLPLSRKHGAPLVVQVLEDLSKRLPDDTWAQSLEIKSVPNQKGREVVVQGETGSGGKILQIVQESPLLKDPVFKATMTRVAPTAERFHIAGELVPAVAPKPLLLSDANALMTVPMTPVAPAGAPAAAKSAATAPPNAAPGAAPAPGAVPPAPASSADPRKSAPAGTAQPVTAPATVPVAPTAPVVTEKKP